MASPTTNWKCYVNLQDVITSTADRSSSCVEVNVFSSRNFKPYVNSDQLPSIDMNLIEGVSPYFLLIRKKSNKICFTGQKNINKQTNERTKNRKKGIKIILIVILSSLFAFIFTGLQSITQADLYLLYMSTGTSVQQCCSTLSTALENLQKHQVTNPLFKEEYMQTILSENTTSCIFCFSHL